MHPSPMWSFGSVAGVVGRCGSGIFARVVRVSGWVRVVVVIAGVVTGGIAAVIAIRWRRTA